MKLLSMNQIAQVFGVDRASVYSWVRRGAPCGAPAGRGKPGQMVFKDILRWRLARFAERGYSESAIVEAEAQARARMRELTAKRKGGALCK